jgi:hypothetical protein
MYTCVAKVVVVVGVSKTRSLLGGRETSSMWITMFLLVWVSRSVREGEHHTLSKIRPILPRHVDSVKGGEGRGNWLLSQPPG